MSQSQHAASGQPLDQQGGERQAADRHVPVMLERTIELLLPALQHDGAVYVDATLGMGGHAERVLELAPQATVVGVDRDTEALDLASRRLARFGERFVPMHSVYDEFVERLPEVGIERMDAVLFDLGVSSLQLDEADRGFAYRTDAPLDMRMDQTTGETAADILNSAAEKDLSRILHVYGEERFARKIARAIVQERQREPFATSERLVELCRSQVPARSVATGGHPAKRTFQALRIAVNTEIETWERALPAALDGLATGGRVAILSYHSLEDRIAKQVLGAGSRSSAPPDLPVELPEHRPWLNLLTRGVERPNEKECEVNPRASSAKLRAAEKMRDKPAGRRAR